MNKPIHERIAVERDKRRSGQRHDLYANDSFLTWLDDEHADLFDELIATIPAPLPEGVETVYRATGQRINELGWEWRTADGEWLPATPMMAMGDYYFCRSPQPQPATERVQWWEAWGRTFPEGASLRKVTRNDNGVVCLYLTDGSIVGALDGTVEVLA